MYKSINYTLFMHQCNALINKPPCMHTLMQSINQLTNRYAYINAMHKSIIHPVCIDWYLLPMQIHGQCLMPMYLQSHPYRGGNGFPLYLRHEMNLALGVWHDLNF